MTTTFTPVRGPAASTTVSSRLKPIHSFWKWQEDAACRDTNVEDFFLEEKLRGHAKRKKEVAAKLVCSGCPVIKECRNHALTTPETYGVWGGMTGDERDVILRAQGFKPEYTKIA